MFCYFMKRLRLTTTFWFHNVTKVNEPKLARYSVINNEERAVMQQNMTGAKMVVKALKDQGVDTIFGYPGGAVLPIYDEIFLQTDIKHVLVRH